MSMQLLGGAFAALLASTSALQRRRARSRHNAWAIRYLEGMPAYLRDDIGLPEGADIRRAVNADDAYAAAMHERHLDQARTPHAT